MNIFNIDLHYHCGLERQEGCSVDDYLKHASMTGRKIVGMTDHIQLYIGCKDSENRRYAVGAEGVLEYYREVDQYREKYKEMKILFAPEISLDFEFSLLPRELIDVCDYFICEPPIADGDHTARILKRMEEMAAFSQKSGKPLFLAHPIRHAINQRMVKCKEVEKWVTELPFHQDWRNYSVTEVNEFFWVDVEALGKASAALNIPIEINGGTHERIVNTNLLAGIQIYTAAYGIMLEQGAQFVCGSDQHTYLNRDMRSGRYIPQHVFTDLGLGVKDITFLNKIHVNL